MYTNNKLSKAVRLAIAFGAASATAFTASVTAAEEDEVAKVERIEVTGSRIKRTDLEGASPVTVLTTEDMKVAGDFTVADALRKSTFNAFGSFSERSGSAAQSQATIDLRGAGSQRTLVLLDGKRFPGSPTLGGASANLNAIPMAAVERIEVMTDGGSSSYGSDAIAGVVNVILKKNYEGLTFNYAIGDRKHDKGTDSREFSVIAGASSDKGNITVSFDHQQRDGIADGDRHYTAPFAIDKNGDGVVQAYTETDGWSIYGATVAAPDFSMASASPLCGDLIAEYGENVFREFAADDDWSAGSTYCMYAYGNVAYNKASIDRNTVFLDANYQITDSIEWFGRAMFVQNSSFGRYAPAAAPWNNMAADNPHNPFGEVTTGYFRWVGVGLRDGNVDDYNQDLLTGIRGNLDFMDAEYEVYYHRNIADNKSVGEFYLSYGGLAHNLRNNIDLGSDEGVANMKATTLTQDSSTFDQYYAGMGFDALELPGGSVAHYVGVEHFTQGYASIYDGQSEAGLVGGSAGNSARGDRHVSAMFYEVALPVLDSLEVNLAVRYDDYSDFGGNTSPKVSLRYEAMDGLVLRASYSEAFRAPALDELYAATSFSAEFAKDYVGCDLNNIPDADCQRKQFNTYYSSNPDLGPETSDYLNLGIAWDITDSFGVKLDYFDLTVDDVIQTQTVQSLINRERNGTLVQTDTFYLKRAPSGTLLEAGTGYNNGSSFNIEGIDLTLSAKIDTGFGMFGMNWVTSHILAYNEETSYEGPIQNTAGWAGQPEFKSDLNLTWTMDNHRIGWNTNYIHSTAGRTELIPNSGGLLRAVEKLDSWTVHNATYTYDAGSYGAVTFTVNNVTDEDPVLDVNGLYSDASLYNNFGREYRVGYSISF